MAATAIVPSAAIIPSSLAPVEDKLQQGTKPMPSIRKLVDGIKAMVSGPSSQLPKDLEQTVSIDEDSSTLPDNDDGEARKIDEVEEVEEEVELVGMLKNIRFFPKRTSRESANAAVQSGYQDDEMELVDMLKDIKFRSG